MVEIQPLRIEIDREEDVRFLASVPELPGVMAYGDTQESALRKAKAIALQVLADMMESGSGQLPRSGLPGRFVARTGFRVTYIGLFAQHISQAR